MRTRARLQIVLMLITMAPAVVPANAKTAAPSRQATAEIEKALTVFLAAFDNPPHMKLAPQDLKIQLMPAP